MTLHHKMTTFHQNTMTFHQNMMTIYLKMMTIYLKMTTFYQKMMTIYHYYINIYIKKMTFYLFTLTFGYRPDRFFKPCQVCVAKTWQGLKNLSGLYIIYPNVQWFLPDDDRINFSYPLPTSVYCVMLCKMMPI